MKIMKQQQSKIDRNKRYNAGLKTTSKLMRSSRNKTLAIRQSRTTDKDRKGIRKCNREFGEQTNQRRFTNDRLKEMKITIKRSKVLNS